MKFSTALIVGSLSLLIANSALATSPPYEHQTIPGVSPEPITEDAGLKSKEDLEAFFDGVMAAHLQAQRIAGATVAVVKDGKLFFAKGYGYADLAIYELIYALPPMFKVALAFPLLAIPLTLGLMYFAWRAWRDGFWTRYGRVQNSVIAVMSVAFLWSLNFMNLVGYKFG